MECPYCGCQHNFIKVGNNLLCLQCGNEWVFKLKERKNDNG